MAALNEADIAVCIIPPRHLWPHIDRIRFRHDSEFPSWPPHIQLVYSSVPVQNLTMHTENIYRAVNGLGPLRVRLTAPDLYWQDERRQAVFLHVDDVQSFGVDGRRKSLDKICEAVLGATQQFKLGGWYRSMTVGQALVDESADGAQSLLLSAGLLSGIEWEVDELHVLVREGLTSTPRPEGSHMIDWATISLSYGGLRVHQQRDLGLKYCVEDNKAVAGRVEVPDVRKFYHNPISPPREQLPALFYDGAGWNQRGSDLFQHRILSPAQPTLTIASYNLHGRTDGCPILIENFLQADAKADVLVLQETTNSFLSHLLQDKRIQEDYAFCTHGSIDRNDCNSLASQKMVVVLSKYAFDWEMIPLPPYESDPDPFKEHEKSYFGGDDNHAIDEIDEVGTIAKVSPIGYRTRTHHRALLVEFRRSEDITDPLKRLAPLLLAAFHLTPGIDRESYHARSLELDAIKHYIDPGTPAILAGGFNMPASMLTLQSGDFRGDVRQAEQDLLSSEYMDAWLAAKMDNGEEADDDPILPGFSGEPGCTDEPTITSTVTDDSGHDQLQMRRQRLDRIMVKTCGLLMVQSFNKFGKFAKVEEDVSSDTLCSSDTSESNNPNSLDTQPPTCVIGGLVHQPKVAAMQENFHWGVRAVVKLGLGPSHPGNADGANNSTSSVAPYRDDSLSSHLKGHESVLEALREVRGLPLHGDCQLREEALKVLKRVLLDSSLPCASSEPGQHIVDFVILPVGSYGLGVWTSSSNLDCLCVGSFSLSTFLDLATQRIRQAAGEDIKLIRKSESYSGTTLILDVQISGEHLRVDLTYARTAWPPPSLSSTTPLSPNTLSALQAYRVLDYIQRSVPDILAFRLAHRVIRLWAESRGIYSAKFGYLNGIQISVLLTRVHKCLATKVASPTVSEILFTFFKEYASFDWQGDMVLDECFHKDLKYARTPREPLAILSYFPPRLNTSLDATVSSVRTITSEFQRAERLLDQEDATWADLLRVSVQGRPTSGSLAADEFLQSHRQYVSIHAQYWGGSTTKGRGFVGWIESRCVSLLADLEKRLTNVHIRMWPIRFTEELKNVPTEDDQVEDRGEYQGVFYIGMDWIGDPTEDQRAAVQDTLETILERFEQQVRRDERHFDAKSMRIGAEVEDRVHSLSSPSGQPCDGPQVDDRNWNSYIQADEDPEDGGGEPGMGQEPTVQDDCYASSKNRKMTATNQPRSVVVPKPPGAGKFRTAADVLNRLRWDSSYDHNEFVVGYEDRFLGAMERGLDVWKTEQMHEEFIPQHRILYFKRRSDGVILWERKTRTDLVFGSG